MLLHIEPDIRKVRGENGRFIPGMKPWNYGKQWSPESSKATQFKKGQNPHNAKPQGYESIRTDKSGLKYIFIKAGRRMVPKHHYLWKLHYGNIPKGCVIAFKDGDQMNCTIDNLMIITRRENILRNINREKANDSLRKLYRRERLRIEYGLPPLSKHGERLTKK